MAKAIAKRVLTDDLPATYTIPDLARQLQCCTAHVWRLIKAGAEVTR